MTDPIDRLYERVLVMRCQAGDARAFAEVVSRYHQRLRAYVGRLLGEAGAADDVLQDVWLDVVRGVSKLRDPDALGGWLYRVARDRAWRTLRRRGVALHPIEAADAVAAADDPESDEDEAGLVRASLDRLAPPHRDVLWLRYVERMTYEQIAAVVGCGLGTVRSRIFYAKRALKRAIERNTGDD